MNQVILNLLETKLDVLSSIPNLNSGGCGIVAYAIVKWLYEQHNINAEIMYLYSDIDHYCKLENEQYLIGNRDEPSACSHAVVVINNRIYDTEYYIQGCDYDEFFYSSQYIDGCDHIFDYNSEFILSSLNSDSWSDWFERENIYTIERILNIDLSEINVDVDVY